MVKSATLLLLLALFSVSIQAQSRASMSSPVVKGGGEAIRLVSRVTSLTPGRSYRIGVGCVGCDLTGTTLQLSLDEHDPSVSLSLSPQDFEQKHTDGWWGVQSLTSRGFVLEGDLLQQAKGGARLSIEIPRTAVEKTGKVYLFVSRKYGEDIWYLEDGIEVDKSYW